MAVTPDIKIERSPRGGRYVARIEGVPGEAELVFTTRAPAIVSADHTFAPDTMRGTGVAAALVERLIADARAQGFRIIALCPYVRAQYARHPQWRDVMAGEP